MTQKNTLLIAYASNHGQAALVARRIAEMANERHFEVTVKHVAETSVEDVAASESILLVASVHYGRHQRAMRRFVTRNRARLAQVHSAFVSVSGDASSEATRPRAEEYVREFFRSTGWTAQTHLVVGGAVKFTKYNFLVRYITRRSLAAKGVQLDPNRDHEFTDWNAVREFAVAFLPVEGTRVA